MQKSIILIVASILIIGGIYFWLQKPTPKVKPTDSADTHATANSNDSQPAGITKYFGDEVKADFNGDGTEDQAFLLTSEPGGSGTFYYLVALLSNADKFDGTNAILIGDRIAPQSTEYQDGLIVVNYADRKPGEPFTTQPSVGMSKYFKIENNKIVEVKK